MKLTRYWKRALCSLLCGVLIVGFLPPKASAAESKTAATVSTEVTSLREENVKHFDMGDGTYQAIMYSHPVHKKDSKGNWQDIDFGMRLTRSQGNSVYTSKTAGAAFAASYTANSSIVTLTGEDSSISMSLVVPQLTAAKRTAIAAKVTGPEGSITTFEEAKNAKFSSSVLYQEVMPGVDLEYVAGIGGFKENIIVKTPMESYAFTFALELDGLRPELQKEGHVLIYDEDTKELKYEIPMPFMYDGMKNICGDVSYTLEEANGTYYLTVTADADWINAEGRTFPVTIDPTFTTTNSTVLDTYISSTLPDSNLGSSAELWIRHNRITYIRPSSTFTPPTGKVLLKAQLLCDYYYYEHVTGGSMYISAHRVLRNWSESTNWNTAAGWNNYGLAERSLSYGRAYGGYHIESPGTVSFDITEAARGWAKGSMSNYGIGLCFVSGNMSVILVSSESGVSNGPRFTYTYTDDYYYTSYYDDTMSYYTDYISNAVGAASTAFSYQFGIGLIENGLPIYDSGLINACPNGANVPCDNFNCLENHHKDVWYIHNELLDRVQSDKERVVYWSDHNVGTYCNHEEGLCTEFWNGVGLVINNSQAIHIQDIRTADDSNEQFEACMGINLIHETAHTFGHGDDNGIGHDVYGGWECVMEGYEPSGIVDFYEKIMNRNCGAFCKGCKKNLWDDIYNS